MTNINILKIYVCIYLHRKIFILVTIYLIIEKINGDMKKMTKQIGRKALSPEEKKKRQIFLENESITARTQRVIEPRITKILMNLDSLVSCANSPRYSFTEETQKKILLAFSKRLQSLDSAFSGKKDSKSVEKVF